MKMITEGTINILGEKSLVLCNSEDLLHVEKHLHRKYSVTASCMVQHATRIQVKNN